MFLGEDIAKGLLAARGLPVPRGRAVMKAEEARAVATELGGAVVVKALVPTGKRGKAGGVRLPGDEEEAAQAAEALLGGALNGFPVEKVLVEEKVCWKQEIYAAVITDHALRCPLVLFSLAGGMEVEEIYASAPEKMLRRHVELKNGFDFDAALLLMQELPLPQKTRGELARFMAGLYDLYLDLDAELVEINPLALDQDGKPVALDCKLIVDDSALKRHPELPLPSPLGTELELRARSLGLNYVQLEGEVGILANGAGLTMSTMDTVAYFGGKPANFLEIGGDAYKLAKPAISIALAHPGIKCLFVNLCGAFARTDVMADGITRGLQELKPDLPVVFSIHGTGEQEAREIVVNRLGIEPFEEMDEAAREAVRLAKKADNAQEKEPSLCS